MAFAAKFLENYFGAAIANSKIEIITIDTPLKTKENILKGVYESSNEN